MGTLKKPRNENVSELSAIPRFEFSGVTIFHWYYKTWHSPSQFQADFDPGTLVVLSDAEQVDRQTVHAQLARPPKSGPLVARQLLQNRNQRMGVRRRPVVQKTGQIFDGTFRI